LKRKTFCDQLADFSGQEKITQLTKGLRMCKLTELFCIVDDFCKEFIPAFERHLLTAEGKTRQRKSRMHMSEIMSIIIHFHQSGYRTFKDYYIKHVSNYLKPFFPQLLSYNRFVELMKTATIPLICFIQSRAKTQTGIYFIDSTSLDVCHIKRAHCNKVFKGIAKKGKSTMGWYFGFKLHILINDIGEIMAFKITESTTDDRKVVPELANNLFGKLIGDKGYLSQKLFDELLDKGLQLITKIKKNMKNKLMPLFDKLLLRKRAIVESVNDQLKNISQIEHSRHRNFFNFIINILAGITAYSLKEKKPSLNLSSNMLAVF
jgi:hypothetical protein